jgi:hypothetical protein
MRLRNFTPRSYLSYSWASISTVITGVTCAAQLGGANKRGEHTSQREVLAECTLLFMPSQHGHTYPVNPVLVLAKPSSHIYQRDNIGYDGDCPTKRLACGAACRTTPESCAAPPVGQRIITKLAHGAWHPPRPMTSRNLHNYLLPIF